MVIYVAAIWYISTVLVHRVKKNLATLPLRRAIFRQGWPDLSNFLPIGQLFTNRFFENYRSAQIFGLLFSTGKVMVFFSKRLTGVGSEPGSSRFHLLSHWKSYVLIRP
jgi:hypothetical protein